MKKCLTCGDDTESTINIVLDRIYISSNQYHPLCDTCKNKWIYVGECALLKIGRNLFYDVNYLLVFPYATGQCMEPVQDPEHLKELSTRVTDWKIKRLCKEVHFDDLFSHSQIK